MALSEELEQYYRQMEELFGTRGWQTLAEEASKRIYELQANALEAPNYDQVCEMRGEAKAWAYLARLEEVTNVTKASLEEEDDYDADVQV